MRVGNSLLLRRQLLQCPLNHGFLEPSNRFVHRFEAVNNPNQATSASTVVSTDIGRIRPSVQTASVVKVEGLHHPKSEVSVQSDYEAAGVRVQKDKYISFYTDSVETVQLDDELPYSNVSLQEEYLENSSKGVIKVKGRLRSHVEFWKSIGASKCIINTIERGYIIPFCNTPPPAVFKNNRSAIEH